MRARALFEMDSWVASRRPRGLECVAIGFSRNKLRVLPVAGSDKGGLFLEGAF